jgi:hypothetical protein
MTGDPTAHAVKKKVRHYVRGVLLTEVFPKSIKGQVASKGAGVTLASKDMVRVFPKQITSKATSVIFVIEYLLSPCRGKEIMHEL